MCKSEINSKLAAISASINT